MNPCAEPARMLRPWLVLLLAGALISGCASRKPKADTDKVDAEATSEEPAEPPADKGDPEGRFAEAVSLMKQKKVKEAEAAFMALTADFPEFSGPQTNLGILFAKSNRRDAAIAAFTRAATANGENAAAFNWLGILNREGGNFERAKQSYEKALSINPDYPAAHLNLGLLYETQLKQPDAALKHYREYLRVTDGKDLRVLPWIGEIESAQAKVEQAKAAAVEAAASAAASEKEVKP
ncbi:MAG: tetratricopeptide repeat protein [Panacagrimonas sp.]